jgi:hypothetical protein
VERAANGRSDFTSVSKFGSSWGHQGRSDSRFATNKTERSQFIPVQIGHEDRQHQKKNDGNEDEERRSRCVGRAALRRLSALGIASGRGE